MPCLCLARWCFLPGWISKICTLLRLFIRVNLLWGRVIGHLFVRSKPAVHRGVLWIGVSLNLASSVFTNTLVFLIRSFSASLH